MTQSLVLVETVNQTICHIKLNRPQAKNALTEQMYDDLTSALVNADNNDSIHVIIISGDNEVFCAGNDLNDFLYNPPSHIHSHAFKFLLSLNKLKKPLIAAVSGPAIGIGTTMLLHCDYVIASETALFKMPFVSLGCSPEGGSSLLLPLLIGQRKAAQLLFLNQAFNAEQALDFNIVNQVVTNDNCISTALTIAEQMASQPPKALQDTKTIMKANIVNQVEQVILAEGELFIQRLHSEEAKAAIDKVINKSHS